MSRRKKRPPRDFSKGIFILPNLFTTASLFSGFYSLIATLNGNYLYAAIAIIVSGVMDGLDGTVARWTHTTSKFGVEYDSLADVVAFGVAPGVLSYVWALKAYGRLGWVVAFLFVACGALRLARFNVNTQVKSSEYFQGLPIPMAASMVAATVFWFNYWGYQSTIQNRGVVVLIFVLSFLMVSNFRYFSLKNPELFKSKPFNTAVVVILLFSLVAVQPKIMFFIIGLSYVVSGPLLTYSQYRESRRHPVPVAPDQPPAEPAPSASSEG